MLYFDIMETERFEQLVEEAVALLPPALLRLMDNVQIVVEWWPSAEQCRSVGLRPGDLLLGLYEGVPRTERGSFYGLVLPDKITLFQGVIERLCQDEAEIRQQVVDTLIHEIGHHFGIDEVRMAELEAERDQKRQSTGKQP